MWRYVLSAFYRPTNSITTSWKGFWGGLSLGLLLIGGGAQAESERTDAGRQIEEIIVTAERQEASIQDTSISITALTGDFIDDFGIRNQDDLQIFIPATTIQPYDATIRGVGRNFRALGGDPGVATYIDGVYSEDLITATAQTFWDVERIEILRGPQGTLYGRNAVGGAFNILHKEPTDTFEGLFKTILGNFGTQEYYGAFSGPLVEDKLAGRINFAYRERDGIVNEIGGGEDLDGLGTENIAALLKWTPTNDLTINIRQNWMDIDRSFGGGNSGGLVVLSEEGRAQRVTDGLIPGYRRIDRTNTAAANRDQNDWFDSTAQIFEFSNPATGEVVEAQRIRPGIDFSDADGFQNAAASLDGFNTSSDESVERYNRCVFSKDVDGSDLCAASNGLNEELFWQQGTQINVAWDLNDRLTLKYIFGYNQLSYQRITDDDNTASQAHDRQFYVNHEADYTSHELQAFWDIRDNITLTSGIFWYDATIDQRGDYYSSLGNERRFVEAYDDQTALTRDQAEAIALSEAAYADADNPTQEEMAVVAAAADQLEGLSIAELVNGSGDMATLFTAKNRCLAGTGGPGCTRNFAVDPAIRSVYGASGQQFFALNLYTSTWMGDDGATPGLNVINGPQTIGSDLLYATQTEREAFAVYSQAKWDINEVFALTLGVRYAYDDVMAEENLYRYTETLGLPASGTRTLANSGMSLSDFNRHNGGLVTDASGAEEPTPRVTNGVPRALSIYRPFGRKDEKVTGRVNLDWQVNDDLLLYFSGTSGYRSGGYNLAFFSTTPSYDPEELMAYEIGYKGQHFDNTLQLNGAVYFYDYETIHTTATEVSGLGGTTTSVASAPGAQIYGLEAEGLWLVNDQWSVGGNLSYTPSEYTEDLYVLDPTDATAPPSIFGNTLVEDTGRTVLAKNVNGNQVLQVPELKYTAWTSYQFNLPSNATLDWLLLYTWIDDVYYSPFQSQSEVAPAFGRVDTRLTWTSADRDWVIAAFVNNALDEVGILQVLRTGEGEFFRQTAGVTPPRLFGVEATFHLGGG